MSCNVVLLLDFTGVSREFGVITPAVRMSPAGSVLQSILHGGIAVKLNALAPVSWTWQ